MEGAEDVVQIFDDFSPTQMVSFPNTRNGDFKNYGYKFNSYLYIYTGLVNIIIIWNTDIMYSQNLRETLVHPECTRKKVIQFDGRPDEVKGMDHVHVAMVFFAIVIVSMKIDITILSFHV